MRKIAYYPEVYIKESDTICSITNRFDKYIFIETTVRKEHEGIWYLCTLRKQGINIDRDHFINHFYKECYNMIILGKVNPSLEFDGVKAYPKCNLEIYDATINKFRQITEEERLKHLLNGK